MKIGFIGAGKVGVSLGKYFLLNGFKVSGYYSRTKESSFFASRFTDTECFNSLEDIVLKSEIIFITTSDGAIEKVWKDIFSLNITGKIICHCSGSLSSAVFFEADKQGAYACSVHPMLAIESKEKAYLNMKNAFFSLEGDEKSVSEISKILKLCGNGFKVLKDKDCKARYHLASVISSNLVIALLNKATELLCSCGFSYEEALIALEPLAENNLRNIFLKGPKNALTGPIERNDIQTVKRHLALLNSKDKLIYKLLSSELLKIASEKHADINYDSLNNILEV